MDYNTLIVLIGLLTTGVLLGGFGALVCLKGENLTADVAAHGVDQLAQIGVLGDLFGGSQRVTESPTSSTRTSESKETSNWDADERYS